MTDPDASGDRPDSERRLDSERQNAAGTLPVSRRTLVRAAGVGAAGAAGIGAWGAAAATGEETEDPDHHGKGYEGGTNQPPSADPVFGFASISGDVKPPVEPDREVRIMVRPVEGREIPEFFYDPCGLYVEPGDTVKFAYTTPHHTITAYHPARGEARRVPEGVPPFSSPVLNAGAYWLYTFEVPGVYDLYCGPHEAFGHVMRVVVGTTEGFEPLPDPCAPPETEPETPTPTPTMTPTATETTTETGPETTEAPAEGGGEPELRMPLFTGYTVLRDPALDPENIVDEGEVRWDDLDAESKQLFFRVEGFPPCSTDDESE